ncbi:MAG TPA: MBL fold metallo-hydrolase [Solimonas sp.]|nr:MBL fold metallo-hydrolase [Solimonas sp.]
MADSSPPAPPRAPRGRFHNRYQRFDHGPSWELVKFLWKMRAWRPARVTLPQRRPDVAWLKANRSVDALTWIGHASFLLQVGGLNVLTDPHLTERASPLAFGEPRRANPPALDFADLPKIDAVVVSHNHYDHLDLVTVRRLAAEHAPVFFVPLGLKDWFVRARIDCEVHELDWWQQAAHRGMTVHAVPVQHFSGRTASDRNRTLWCGFVLEVRGRKVFFAGDTGYSRDFIDIRQRFGPMDLSLLPIGAYDPRGFMAPVHVNPAEAVQIHRDLECRQSVAMHWGTFRLTLEPLDEPPQQLATALAAAGIAPEKFVVMQHGETTKPVW